MTETYDQREALHATQPKTLQGSTVALIRMDNDGNIAYGGEKIDVQRLIYRLVAKFGESDGE